MAHPQSRSNCSADANAINWPSRPVELPFAGSRWDSTRSLCSTCKKLLRNESTNYHGSEASFFSALHKGCLICVNMLKYLNVQGLEKYVETRGHDQAMLCIGVDSEWFHDSDGVIRLRRLDFFSRRNNTIDEAYFRVFAKIVDACPKFRSEIPGSEQNSEFRAERFSQIRQWLSVCQTSHTICMTYRQITREKPTRLLNVGNDADGTVRLEVVDQSAFNMPYVTLSHRWGQPEPPKLTRASFQKLKSGVAKSTLPRAFRDAIYIAIKVGVKYLWIDSLCIFQDSAEDWRCESQRMAGIYAGALFNISATSSENSQYSCVQSPVLPGLVPVLPHHGRNLQQTTFIELHDANALPVDISLSILSTRGWVQQEWELAPATLHCTSTQLHWHCSESRFSETYPEGRQYGFDFYDQFQPVERLFGLKSLITSIAQGSTEATCLDAINTKLTKEDDRFIAIGGLKNAMNECFNNSTLVQYHSGVWSRYLIEQLNWKSTDVNCHRRQINVAIPTWSWASIQGPVAFTFVPFSKYTRGDSWVYDYVISRDLERRPQHLAQAEFLNINSQDEFGQSATRDGCAILVKGILVQTYLANSSDSTLIGFKGFHNVVDSVELRYDCIEERDISDQWGLEYYILPLLYSDDSGCSTIQGILLRGIVGPFRTIPNFSCRQLIRCGWIEISSESFRSAMFSCMEDRSWTERETFYIF